MPILLGQCIVFALFFLFGGIKHFYFAEKLSDRLEYKGEHPLSALCLYCGGFATAIICSVIGFRSEDGDRLGGLCLMAGGFASFEIFVTLFVLCFWLREKYLEAKAFVTKTWM